MADGVAKPAPPKRPEFERVLPPMAAIGDVARPLSPFEKLINLTSVRRILIVLALAAIWQAYGAWLSTR